MLGCTCMIHLGIQWPNIWFSRAYDQHQHGMFYSLCHTFPIMFSCVLEIYAQHKCKYSCALYPLAEHKTSHRSRALGSTPNIDISSIMSFRVHARHKHFINHVLQGPHPTQTYIYIYIYISSTIGLHPNIQKKSSCLYVVGSLTKYKIKHQYNHHDQ